ncbi:Valine--tRNA ligase [Fusarium oxysporum f. sp. albedinis]|nr:Valine--tRNA ligase [Fusarium oxysporum f. sp. albedinis]
MSLIYCTELYEINTSGRSMDLDMVNSAICAVNPVWRYEVIPTRCRIGKAFSYFHSTTGYSISRDHPD